MNFCLKCGVYVPLENSLCARCASAEESKQSYPGSERKPHEAILPIPAAPPVLQPVVKMSTIIGGVYWGTLLASLTGAVLYAILTALWKM